MHIELSEHNDKHLNNTYEIVSKIGFLIGVKKEVFEIAYEPLELEWFNELCNDKNARIIRNLCALRTIIFLKYKKINAEIYYNTKNLDTLTELIPQSIIQELADDGIMLIHVNWKINQYILLINSEINQRISGCKHLFPLWIKWEYIRNLFVIPKVENSRQIKAVWGYYTNNLDSYPYQMYINLRLHKSGNILYNDEKFVTILYGNYGKEFVDRNKVNDASDFTKNSIYTFIEQSDEIAIVVDCENANPYKLYSMLYNLPQEYSDKIVKLILYNDIHTSTVWKIFKRFLNISIQHEMIDRIKDNKSLVDIKLTAGTCREYYKNHINSFILISSDSDYWGLITSMEECRFMVMVEYEKCSSAIVKAMKEKEVPYCYLDKFCSGDLESIQSEALLIEIRNSLKQYVIPLHALVNEAIKNTRVDLSPQEIEQFKNRYLKKIKMVLDDENISFDI